MRKKAWSVWLKSKEVEQWARTYLDGWSRRNPGNPSGRDLYDRLCQLGTLREDTSLHRELLRKMSGAWNAKNFRRRTDLRKQCSFALSIEAERQLDKLAKGKKKNHTLERIILERAEQASADRSAKQDEEVYKRRTKVFEKHLDVVLEELCSCKLILTEAGIDTARKSQQQSEVSRLVRERKKMILAELPALPSKQAANKKNRSARSVQITANAGTIAPSLSSATPSTDNKPHHGDHMRRREDDPSVASEQPQQNQTVAHGNRGSSELRTDDAKPAAERAIDSPMPSNEQVVDDRPNWMKVRERMGLKM